MRERAVRMVVEARRESGEKHGAVTRIAKQLGVGTESLRNWVNRAEVNAGRGRGRHRRMPSGSPSSSVRWASCAPGERHLESRIGFLRDRARRSTQEVVAFIDAHRMRTSGGRRWGVEPIWCVLEIAPSTYWSAKSRPPSARAIADAVIVPLLVALFMKNYSVYGRRKLTKAARKAGLEVGRVSAVSLGDR